MCVCFILVIFEDKEKECKVSSPLVATDKLCKKDLTCDKCPDDDANAKTKCCKYTLHTVLVTGHGVKIY